jgi:DNA-binding transcriptional LysR family regulator
MIMLPDTNGWAALRAVVELGGVSEAAKALHVGQPAITKRLRALEKVYGIPLTERRGGRLQLTPAGEKVYLLAVQTLDRQRALATELQVLTSGLESMRLQVNFAIGEHLLPELLIRFDDLYPNFRVESRMGYGRKIQTELATGIADLALLEQAPDHPDVLVQKWMDDELWLLCGPTHPLAGTDLLPVTELASLNYVLREKHSSIRDGMEEALQRIGIVQLQVAMEVGSNEAITEILTRGKHVSFLPRFAVEESVRNGDLFHIKVTGFRIIRTLWIARHRSKLEHPVAEAFVGMLREKREA